jgi:hypothetical protein
VRIDSQRQAARARARVGSGLASLLPAADALDSLCRHTPSQSQMRSTHYAGTRPVNHGCARLIMQAHAQSITDALDSLCRHTPSQSQMRSTHYAGTRPVNHGCARLIMQAHAQSITTQNSIHLKDSLKYGGEKQQQANKRVWDDQVVHNHTFQPVVRAGAHHIVAVLCAWCGAPSIIP